MRLPIISIVVVALYVSPLTAQSKKKKEPDPPAKIHLESEPDGWTDLLDKDLKTWKRVAVPAGSRLSRDVNPWSVSADGKTLHCNTGGMVIHELLLCNKEVADGILHVEWKFTRDPRKSNYATGVYVRTAADGNLNHMVHIGSKQSGNLGGRTLVNGKLRPTGAPSRSERVKDPCDWNTTEVVCSGNTMTVWVNGYQTTEWAKCEVPKGFVGVASNGGLMEFRNLKWKEKTPAKNAQP